MTAKELLQYLNPWKNRKKSNPEPEKSKESKRCKGCGELSGSFRDGKCSECCHEDWVIGQRRKEPYQHPYIPFDTKRVRGYIEDDMDELPEGLDSTNKLGPEIYTNGAYGDLHVDTGWLGASPRDVHMVLPTNTGAYDEHQRIMNIQRIANEAVADMNLQYARQKAYAEQANKKPDLLGPIKAAVEAKPSEIPQKRRKIKI